MPDELIPYYLHCKSTRRYSVVVVEVQCLGCNATVPDLVGPVHASMLASPGCWSLYCSLLEVKFTGHFERIGPLQGLVDVYAAQHATSTNRRNLQSAALQLISLCAGLEHDVPQEHRRVLIGRLAHLEYLALHPAPASFTITVRDVADAEDSTRLGMTSDGEAATWPAWSAHQERVRAWLNDECRSTDRW